MRATLKTTTGLLAQPLGSSESCNPMLDRYPWTARSACAKERFLDRGFTLWELTIVVVIASALVLLLVPKREPDIADLAARWQRLDDLQQGHGGPDERDQAEPAGVAID